MTFRDLRLGWRALTQEPAYLAVAVSGLGIGLAAAALLLGLVRYSTQYNAHVPDAEHVYVVKQRFNVDPKAPVFDQAPLFLRAVAGRLPGVIGATGYVPTRPLNRPLTLRGENHGALRRLDGLTVLPGFTATLGVRALAGNLDAALAQPDSFAITRQAALRLFGSGDAVGRTLRAEGQLLRVAAVVETPPSNTTIPFEALFGASSLLGEPELRHELLTGDQGWWGKLLIRVRPDASVADITQALQRTLDDSAVSGKLKPEARQRLGQRHAMELSLAPLRDAYFDEEVAGNGISAPGERARPAVVAALAALALLIVALAAVNYVNLSTLRVLRRQRDIAMRMVLGAGARRIATQLLIEALLVALLATALALLLAWLALPAFCRLVQRDLGGLFTPGYVAAALAGGVMLGMLTALHPTALALRVRPALALAGRPGGESPRGMRLRRALTVLQLAAAMGLAGVALAVAWQSAFAMRASPGFDAAPLLVVDLPQPVRDSAAARGFIAALAARPGVAGVAVSEDAVGRRNAAWFHELKRPDGVAATMEIKSVSANFFALYGIRPLTGRLFDARIDSDDDAQPVVLNALAARALGYATPQAALDATLLFADADGKLVGKRIVGIAPELRFQTLREAPAPVAYELWTAGTTVSVRASGAGSASVDIALAEQSVRALWPRYFPETLLQMRPAGQILAANYADDARMARLLAVAAGIALAIAAFGTYALSANTVRRRAMEIVLRKLHGARRADIGWLVAAETGRLTLAGAVLGLPLAAVAIERYLAGYVLRAPVGGWTLLLALALTLATAVAAVARHAWLAMRLRPADALRG